METVNGRGSGSGERVLNARAALHKANKPTSVVKLGAERFYMLQKVNKFGYKAAAPGAVMTWPGHRTRGLHTNRFATHHDRLDFSVCSHFIAYN